MLLRYKELILGIFIGTILMFAVYFLSQFIQQRNTKRNESGYVLQSGTKIDTLKVGNYKIEVKAHSEIQIKEQNELLGEKIKSLNDRLGDMYLSMTIIIALLLAIVAGVYFKTETEVAKHMNKNYGEYKKEIESMNAEAQSLLAQIKTKADLTEQIIPNQETNQQIEAAE